MLRTTNNIRWGDVASHELLLPCHALDRRPFVRGRYANCQHRTMTAGAAPEPLTIEQWEQILPVAPVQTGALIQVEHEDVDEFLIAAVIESDEFEAVVAPLSASHELAAEWDIIIGEQALGWPAAI
jgi:hypothetical protein